MKQSWNGYPLSLACCSGSIIVVILFIIALISVEDSAVFAEEVRFMPASAPTQAMIGEGTASWQLQDGVYLIQCQVTKRGVYVENWNIDATVFDLRLASAQTLSPETNRIGLAVRNPNASGKPNADFRILLGDSTGGEWAVATQLQGGYGQLPQTEHFEKIETMPFQFSDSGRVGPWVMTAVGAKQSDEYTHPQPPFKLLGVRVIVKAEGMLDFSVRNIHPINAGKGYDPSWTFCRNSFWAYRARREEQPSRSGWGEDEATPFLRPDDLCLHPGEYAYTWELTDLETQTPRASASGEFVVAPDTSVSVRFPLLPVGTYRLHMYVREDSQPLGREYFLHHLVHANSQNISLPVGLPPKPLTCHAEAGPVFKDIQSARINLSAHTPEPEDRIVWTVLSADNRQLISGQGLQNVQVNLSDAFAQGEASVCLDAMLVRDGKTIDRLRRVFGCSRFNNLDRRPPYTNIPGGKKQLLSGLFERTKGDWSEGGTPIVSRQDEFYKKFTDWMNDALYTGYNIVELSAPWYELEPLPGVYEFRYLDTIVKLATDRGLAVMLRVHPCVDKLPEWLDRQTQRSADGRWVGIWKGGSTPICTLASDVMRNAQETFLSALASHYAPNRNVIGYTLGNAFFDHGFIDMPHLSQYSGYSEQMRIKFCQYLQKKYGTVDAASLAHKTNYAGWEQIPLPKPVFKTTTEGRLLPRCDALWLDYIDCKRNVILSFRTQAIDALRRGDPGCIIGPYADDARALMEDYLDKHSSENVMLAQGSMEDLHPPLALGYEVRYEPIRKVTHTSPITDVGVSNLLFYQPGRNTFFNYWSVHWHLPEVEPTILEAENRLKQWFSCVDKLMGAMPLPKENETGKPGLVVASLETLLNTWQHTFSPRFKENYLAAYMYRCGLEQVDSRVAYSNQLAALLDGTPYVYIPCFNDEISHELAVALESYVRSGGRLILDGNAGNWTEKGVTAGSLRELLQLPTTRVQQEPLSNSAMDSGTEVAQIDKNATMLQGLRLVFRTRQWYPPIGSEPSWLHRCARGYFLPARFTGTVSDEAQVLARIGADPVALRIPFGQGEILAFSGATDWSASTDLAVQLDNWGKGLPLVLRHKHAQDALVSAFIKNKTIYAVGRRIISGQLLGEMVWGKKYPLEAKEKHATSIPVNNMPSGMWHIRELLNRVDCGSLQGEQIRAGGIHLSLSPGEAFLLEIEPVPFP